MNNLIRICLTNLLAVFYAALPAQAKSKKRKFINNRGLVTASLVIALIVFTGCSGRFNKANEKRPNLLIIHTDEQTFRSISCYDNSWKDLQTPNIDFLANNGVRCEKFYTNHPVCTPSRTSLLTGIYAQKVDSYLNDIPLKPGTPTLGNFLKQYSYVTGYSGKVHLAEARYPGFTPSTNFGFDDNLYMFNNGHMKKLIMDENGRPQSPGGIGDEKTYTTDFLTDRTIEFMEKNKSNDWCYMVSFPDPHDPNTERTPYNSMFKPEDMKFPSTFRLPEGIRARWEPNLKEKNDENISDVEFYRKHKALYYGMVKHIDDCVGRIIKYLKSNGLLDNTIIVYTTDHGDMMGEFSRYDKGVFYDASAKIPFIMYFPQKIKSNTIVRQVISNIDFLPTILDMMDIPSEKEYFDGSSAADLLTGQGDNDWPNIAFLSMSERVAIITGRFKLILGKNAEPWLIDLLNDPDEMENSINKPENQDTVRVLAQKLKNYLEKNADPNWTDTLTELYDRRYKQHQQFREPSRQRAVKREVSWKEELVAQLDKLSGPKS